MARHPTSTAYAALVILGLATCDGTSAADPPPPATSTQAFAFVETPASNTPAYDIRVLNRWLRANPDKKVVSFSGVLAYREGVSGYIVAFTPGDNSHQEFARINLPDARYKRDPVHGMGQLQAWRDANPNARIVGFAAVPAYSGGVREFTVCYEHQ